jgi:hypothetical protein
METPGALAQAAYEAATDPAVTPAAAQLAAATARAAYVTRHLRRPPAETHRVAALIIDTDPATGRCDREVSTLADAAKITAIVLGPGRNVEQSGSLDRDPWLLDLDDAEYAELTRQGYLDVGKHGLEILVEMDSQ